MKEKLKTKHYGSVFDSEQKLLKAILEIHNNNKTFDIDPMYFKGNFYKDIDRPKSVFDIEPLFPFVKNADVKSLPVNSNSINSMILDPPFMIATRKTQREYYSSRTHSYYISFDELEQHYKGFLKEAHRV